MSGKFILCGKGGEWVYSNETRVALVKQRVRNLQCQRKRCKCYCLFALSIIVAVLLYIVAATVQGREKIHPQNGERRDWHG